MLNMRTGLYGTSTAAEVKISIDSDMYDLSGRSVAIAGLVWSYEGGTLSTDAGLKIWVGTTGSSDQVFDLHINGDGAGFILPAEPVKFPHGKAVIFELVSGGTGVCGKLNIFGIKLV